MKFGDQDLSLILFGAAELDSNFGFVGDDLLPIGNELPWDVLSALASWLPPLLVGKATDHNAYDDRMNGSLQIKGSGQFSMTYVLCWSRFKGTDGPVDTKCICGTVVARQKARAGRGARFS